MKPTKKGPTGYEVTFRYEDRNATQVQIKGEWYFADPTQLPPSSTTTNTIVTPENETAWSTKGVAGHILDNLINTGQIKPMLVVMPNGSGLPGDIDDILHNIIPYVESHFRVSTSASDRAMAGLSRGSGVTNSMLFNHTSEFAYYGSFSRGPSYRVPAASELTPQQVDALRQVKGIFVGAGWEEFLHPYSPFMINTLTSIGAP